VQSVEVKLPCFLYIYSGGGPMPAGAIATIMAELASRSTRSGVSGHSLIHPIGSNNVIVDIVHLTGVVGQNHSHNAREFRSCGNFERVVCYWVVFCNEWSLILVDFSFQIMKV